MEAILMIIFGIVASVLLYDNIDYITSHPWLCITLIALLLLIRPLLKKILGGGS